MTAWSQPRRRWAETRRLIRRLSCLGKPEPAAPSFTSVAPYYDKLMASVPYRFWLSYIEALWKTHGIKPRRVLDLACGTGTVSLLLAGSGMDVVGVDISPEMIEAAWVKQRESGAVNVEFRIADAADMPPDPALRGFRDLPVRQLEQHTGPRQAERRVPQRAGEPRLTAECLFST